jgi:hypothetical protein
MILLRVVWYGFVFVGLFWMLIDVVIPLLMNKPLFTTFKRSDKKQAMLDELKDQSVTLEELELEKKVILGDIEIEKVDHELDSLHGQHQEESNQPVGNVETTERK